MIYNLFLTFLSNHVSRHAVHLTRCTCHHTGNIFEKPFFKAF